jgi:uncharacterized protein (DUF1778 family)
MAMKTKERWDFRVEPNADELVRQAAKVSHRSLTAFVVEAALGEAERIVADRTRFALDPHDWNRFEELLDRPVQHKPRLERLLAEPSVFE